MDTDYRFMGRRIAWWNADLPILVTDTEVVIWVGSDPLLHNGGELRHAMMLEF